MGLCLLSPHQPSNSLRLPQRVSSEKGEKFHLVPTKGLFQQRLKCSPCILIKRCSPTALQFALCHTPIKSTYNHTGRWICQHTWQLMGQCQGLDVTSFSFGLRPLFPYRRLRRKLQSIGSCAASPAWQLSVQEGLLRHRKNNPVSDMFKCVHKQTPQEG